MKNIVNLLLVLLLTGAFPISNTCKAQSDSISNKKNIAKNAIYVEAFGNGWSFLDEVAVIWGTLNYERTIICSKHVNCSIRMGFGYNRYQNPYLWNDEIFSYYSLPLLFNSITNPNGSNHLEAGLGIVLTNDAWDLNKNYEVGYTASLKYRYQKKTKGIYFSAGLTPSIYYDPFIKYVPDEYSVFSHGRIHLAAIGICIGYHF